VNSRSHHRTNRLAVDTAYIQQAHIAILHTMCDLVERMLIERDDSPQRARRAQRGEKK